MAGGTQRSDGLKYASGTDSEKAEASGFERRRNRTPPASVATRAAPCRSVIVPHRAEREVPATLGCSTASGGAVYDLAGRTSLTLARAKTPLSASKSHCSMRQLPSAACLPQRSRFTELGTPFRTLDETAVPA